MQKLAGYIIFSVLLVLLQTTVIRYLTIEGITPDIVLLWIVYIAIREGQTPAIVAGFVLGLLVDLLSGNDGMMGLSALSKTTVGFAAGFLYDETRTMQSLGSYRFPLLILGISLLHNIIYFVIILRGSSYGWPAPLVQYGFPTSVYTAALALLPMFAFARKGRSLL